MIQSKQNIPPQNTGSPASKTRETSASSAQDIARRAERLQRTRRQPPARPLRGLGAFGVIGWSVAVPTVAGAVLGLWLEKAYPQAFSWPIALILGGLVIGIMVAWEWIARQQREEEALARVQSELVTPPAKVSPTQKDRPADHE